MTASFHYSMAKRRQCRCCHTCQRIHRNNARIMWHCSAFELCLYHLVYLTPFIVAGNNKPYLRRHVNFPTFLSDFSQIWNLDLLTYFQKKRATSNFTEICPVGVALVHENRRVDGRKDMKLMCTLRNYVKVLKNHGVLWFNMFREIQ